ncbi:MAG: NUDIX domain-containing protein [Gammaproteobacteria bacterium]|nr:NUDIX domain-containing protein [Gammaproteobacteria bacterium]MYF66305.1 NUDIX domain-containing protein [Gammaproteobacteria bacterium]MYK38322.1 NUDIX domain-containing protein [Gammaproteobacteria bacterium]
MSGPTRGMPWHFPRALPSATLMLLRQSRAGLEVLLLRRITRAAFGGAWVFPGGVLDEQDGDVQLHRRCLGLDDSRASRMLGLPRNGLDYWVAAIRETFEETGVLAAVNGCGQGPRGTLADRRALLEGRIRFAELCRRRNWRLPVRRLHYVSHWITPSAAPRRFSTRFFLAESSPGIRVHADGREILQARWFEPGQALERKIPLAHPTRHCLRILSEMGSVSRAKKWAASMARKPVPVTRPEVRRIDGELMSCLPTGEVLGPFRMKDYPAP